MRPTSDEAVNVLIEDNTADIRFLIELLRDAPPSQFNGIVSTLSQGLASRHLIHLL